MSDPYSFTLARATEAPRKAMSGSIVLRKSTPQPTPDQAIARVRTEAAQARYRFAPGPDALVGARPGDFPGLTERQTAHAMRSEQQQLSAHPPAHSDNSPRLGDTATPPDPTLSPSLPLTPSAVVSAPVADTIAAATNVPLPYLNSLIQQESGGDPNAAASTSSAVGLTQMSEGTWLELLRRHGARYGLPEGLTKQQLLDLRHDPQWSVLMGARFAQENEATLRANLGRRVTEGEVYLGHFLGAQDAVSLIRAATARGNTLDRKGRPATQFVAQRAVDANRNIFFDKGRPLSAREVYSRQTQRFRSTMFPIQAGE